jgi:ATP/maltotriose-dependent transcriptional regulator MalT
MKKQVLTFGIIGGLLITVLQWTQFRFIVIEHSVEIYGGIIAVIFAVLGIWLGVRLSRPRKHDEANQPDEQAIAGQPNPTTSPFLADEQKREQLGITRRELEVLGLIAQGMSNREIAGKLFVSENTVKTHSSRVFDKLGARRRTQAVQLGKEFGLLP